MVDVSKLYGLTFKGSPTTKSQYLHKNLPVKTKTAFLSKKLILLAILLHGQFIHYTHISLHPNIHLFNAQQRAGETSWCDSVYILVACWVNFRQKCLHQYEQ